MTDELIKRNDKKPEFKLVDIPFLRQIINKGINFEATKQLSKVCIN